MSQEDESNQLAIAVAAAAAVVGGLFAAAQLTLITRVAKLIVTYGLSDLLHIQLRKTAREIVLNLERTVPGIVDEQILSVLKPTEIAPENAVTAFHLAGDTFQSHADRAVRAIADDLNGKLNQLNYGILRFADDAYRAVAVDAASVNMYGGSGGQTVYEALVHRGIDGFTDSRGRKWELASYVDMAVRTATQRAFNVAHLDRMQAEGIDLFTVSDDGNPCPLCLPWQGRILSVLPDERATATIAFATDAGLFHPNCRHVLIGFIPGVVIPAPREWTAEDQRKYDESQHQRALERQIRAAKRMLAGATTDEMHARAVQELHATQARMREFIDRTGLLRRSHREQINKAF